MNFVAIVGRLVSDPELKYTPSGSAVCNMLVAVDRNMSKEKKADAKAKGQQTADFIKVVAWDKVAELCGSYLAKGRLVAIDGQMQTQQYLSKDNQKLTSVFVLLNHVDFLSPPSENRDNLPKDNNDFSDVSSIEDDDDLPF